MLNLTTIQRKYKCKCKLLRYHQDSVQTSDNTKVLQESRAPGTLTITCWNVNCFHQFGKNWKYLPTQIPYLTYTQKFLDIVLSRAVHTCMPI